MRVAPILFPFVLALNHGAEPLFVNSIASNDLDFIRTDGPSPFESASFLGRKRKEMPDK
jgi:hypothetical protein